MIDYSTVAKQTKAPFYKIKTKYEHGDADSTTHLSITFDEYDKEEFEKTLEFYYKVLNFLPNRAYDNLGQYYPIKDISALNLIISKFWPDEKYPQDLLTEYMHFDNFYREDVATLQKVYVYINGIERLLLNEEARKSNIIKLPEIGSIIETTMGNITGRSTVFKEAISYQDVTKLHNISLKTKNKYTSIHGIVKDIKCVNRNSRYDTFDILFSINGLSNVYVVNQFRGYVPEYVHE